MQEIARFGIAVRATQIGQLALHLQARIDDGLGLRKGVLEHLPHLGAQLAVFLRQTRPVGERAEHMHAQRCGNQPGGET